MKLLLHELEAAIAAVAADRLQRAFKMLARVSKIMEQLVHAWDVLATMTPPEYSTMRPSLASSSGFQSWQYRSIEFMLGNKNAAMLKPHAHRPDLLARVQAAARRAVALRRVAAPARAARPAGAGRPRRARLVAAVRRERSGRAGLARRLPRPGGALGPLPARRGAHRPRGHVPALALSPRDDRRARDRLQARHRRHRRRQLSAERCSTSCSSPRSGSCAPISERARSARSRAAPRARTRAGPGRRTSASPTKKVGAPKTPRLTASSVVATSRALTSGSATSAAKACGVEAGLGERRGQHAGIAEVLRRLPHRPLDDLEIAPEVVRLAHLQAGGAAHQRQRVDREVRVEAEAPRRSARPSAAMSRSSSGPSPAPRPGSRCRSP